MLFSIPFTPYRNDKKEKMISVICDIKEGNQDLREKFIKDNIPFIIKTASKALGKYVDIDNEDEYSIALFAFNEAINTFDLKRNDNFWYYSDLVIKRKIIDNFRVNKKNNKVYPFTFFENGEEMFEERLSQLEAADAFEDIDAKDELELFKSNLNSYGISMDDLISRTPRHKDSIKLYIKIARIIAEDDELFNKLVRKKTVPILDLVNRVEIHRKTLERNRKFIIAICLILKSNLEVMKSFIKYTERGGGKGE